MLTERYVEFLSVVRYGAYDSSRFTGFRRRRG